MELKIGGQRLLVKIDILDEALGRRMQMRQRQIEDICQG